MQPEKKKGKSLKTGQKSEWISFRSKAVLERHTSSCVGGRVRLAYDTTVTIETHKRGRSVMLQSFTLVYKIQVKLHSPVVSGGLLCFFLLSEKTIDGHAASPLRRPTGRKRYLRGDVERNHRWIRHEPTSLPLDKPPFFSTKI